MNNRLTFWWNHQAKREHLDEAFAIVEQYNFKHEDGVGGTGWTTDIYKNGDAEQLIEDYQVSGGKGIVYKNKYISLELITDDEMEERNLPF